MQTMQTLEPHVRRELLRFLRREHQARSALVLWDSDDLTAPTVAVLNMQAAALRLAMGIVLDQQATGYGSVKAALESIRHDLVLEDQAQWRLLDPRHAALGAKAMWETLFRWEAALARACGASSFPPKAVR